MDLTDVINSPNRSRLEEGEVSPTRGRGVAAPPPPPPQQQQQGEEGVHHHYADHRHSEYDDGIDSNEEASDEEDDDYSSSSSSYDDGTATTSAYTTATTATSAVLRQVKGQISNHHSRHQHRQQHQQQSAVNQSSSTEATTTATSTTRTSQTTTTTGTASSLTAPPSPPAVVVRQQQTMAPSAAVTAVLHPYPYRDAVIGSPSSSSSLGYYGAAAPPISSSMSSMHQHAVPPTITYTEAPVVAAASSSYEKRSSSKQQKKRKGSHRYDDAASSTSRGSVVLRDGGASALEDVSSLAIYLREKKLDAGLHDVKSVLKRLQRVLEEKESRVVGLESQCEAQSNTIAELHKENAKLRRMLEENKRSVEQPMRRQVATLGEDLKQRMKDNAQLKTDLDEALWRGQDWKKRSEIAANQAEDLRIGLDKLRADYDILIARAAANEEQLAEFSKARAGIRGQHESQLSIMEMKYANLESQCHDLRNIREALEEKLKEAQLRSNEHSLKSQHRTLMESAEVHRKAQENLALEEQLHAAHVNNCRLLRLLMETEEFADLVEFNSASQSFDFIRREAGNGGHGKSGRGGGGSSSTTTSTGLAGCDVVAGSYHDPHRHTTRSKNAFLNGLSSKHQAMHDAIDCENRYLGGCVNLRGGNGNGGGGATNGNAAGGDSGGGGHSGALVLHRHHSGGNNNVPVHLSSGAGFGGPHPFYPLSDAGGPLRPREIIDLKTESHYWIPHNAFIEAQQWRDETVPNMPINSFYDLFIRLNEIWRDRMQQRLEVQARQHQKKMECAVEHIRSQTAHDLLMRARNGTSVASAASAVASSAIPFAARRSVSSQGNSRRALPHSGSGKGRSRSNGGGGGAGRSFSSPAVGSQNRRAASPSPSSSSAAFPSLPTEAELNALRRDVKAKAFSRVAINLFSAYDALLCRAADRAAALERNATLLLAGQARAEALRGPTDTVLYDCVDGAANTERAVAGQLEANLSGASGDVKRFLAAVERTSVVEAIGSSSPSPSSPSSPSPSSTTASVPATLLLRVINFMSEFADEVVSQSSTACHSLRSSADGLDAVLAQHKQLLKDRRVGAGLGLGHEGAAQKKKARAQHREHGATDADDQHGGRVVYQHPDTVISGSKRAKTRRSHSSATVGGGGSLNESSSRRGASHYAPTEEEDEEGLMLMGRGVGAAAEEEEEVSSSSSRRRPFIPTSTSRGPSRDDYNYNRAPYLSRGSTSPNSYYVPDEDDADEMAVRGGGGRRGY